MVRLQLGKKEVPKDFETLGMAIKTIISEKGIELLKNTDAFIEVLKEKNIDNVVSMQLGLLLEAGNIRNYLTQRKTGVSMIDVNNMIACAETETGLTKRKLKYLLSAVLFGLGLPTSIETVEIPHETDSEFVNKALVSVVDYSEKLEEIKQAVKNKNIEKLNELSVDFERFVNSGIAEAQYLKGICYLNGIATEENSTMGYKLISAAASAGHAEANGVLGDYYFEDSINNNYTKAFNYYTQLGAVALSKERKNNLKIIMASKKQNLVQIIISGLLLLLIYIFNQKIGGGVFSADMQTHWGWAITSDILASAVFGVSILEFLQLQYNRTKWVTGAMFVIMTITAFFALI